MFSVIPCFNLVHILLSFYLIASATFFFQSQVIRSSKIYLRHEKKGQDERETGHTSANEKDYAKPLPVGWNEN